MTAGFLKAQENVQPTLSFSIEGKVKIPAVFSLADSIGFTIVSIDSVAIYNHLLQKKRVIKSIKGLLLKDILSKVEFDAPAKVLSEFYITCIASDNYKVVFSWNELFNTDIGKHVMIITEESGKKGTEMADRIALLCPADYATGRRFIKGLQKIIVERVK
jgi:hypothetical protein